jgi:hypothetical protein
MCPFNISSPGMQDANASKERSLNLHGGAYRGSALRGARHNITRELLGFAISAWGKPPYESEEPAKVEETEFKFCYSHPSRGPAEHEQARLGNATSGPAFSESGETASEKSTSSWWAASHRGNGRLKGAVTENDQEFGEGDGNVTHSVQKRVAASGLQRHDFVQVMSTNRERLVATTQDMRKVRQRPLHKNWYHRSQYLRCAPAPLKSWLCLYTHWPAYLKARLSPITHP